MTFASWSLALVGSCSSADVDPRQQLRAVARASPSRRVQRYVTTCRALDYHHENTTTTGAQGCGPQSDHVVGVLRRLRIAEPMSAMTEVAQEI